MAKQIAKIGKNCAACGNCVTACPRHAISIYKGLQAKVDLALCVGCGKCERICPAGIISIGNRPEAAI